jgi:hypothetical protein
MLKLKMAISPHNPIIWLTCGFCFGLVVFVRGLLLYRRALLVEDTPAMPIRSVAMGLVQIHGTACGERTIWAPVSGTSCYAYKIRIERVGNKLGMRGSHVRTDSNGVRFYLEDTTGRVSVEPEGAEFDVPETSRREVATEGQARFANVAPLDFDTGPALDGNPASDQYLLAYARGQSLGFFEAQPYRFIESCIVPEREYTILGTCGQNPKPADDSDRNLIARGQHESAFLISSKAEVQLQRTLSQKSKLMVVGGAALSMVCAAGLLNFYNLL